MSAKLSVEQVLANLERREVLYDMSRETPSRSLTVPAEVRAGRQQEIRRQVLEIGALYRLQGRAAPGRAGKVARSGEPVP